MCESENLGCLDEACCSLRAKIVFFAFWTFIHGLSAVTITIILHTWFPDEFRGLALAIIVTLLSIIHLAAGTALLVGVLKGHLMLFKIGVALSWIGPVCYFLYGYILPAQVIFTILCYRYYILGMI